MYIQIQIQIQIDPVHQCCLTVGSSFATKVWFQNERSRQLGQSRLGSANSQGEGPSCGQEQPPAWTPGESPAYQTGLFWSFSFTQERVCVGLSRVGQEGLGKEPTLPCRSCLPCSQRWTLCLHRLWGRCVISGTERL